ncbi:MAG: hypothetical protein AAB533_01665 [Patescibacteria group bacterium]
MLTFESPASGMEAGLRVQRMSGSPVFCCNLRSAAAAPNGSPSPYHPIRLGFRRGASLALRRFRHERGLPDMLYAALT